MGQSRDRLSGGWLSIEKRCSPQRWVAHWYVAESYVRNGRVRYKQRSCVVGLKTRGDLPTKSAAEAKWASIRNQVMAPTPPDSDGSVVTFSDFVHRRFIPSRQSNWRPRSRERFEYLLAKMIPSVGSSLLSDLDRVTLQKFLDRLASRYSYDTVHLAQSYLRAIFAMALDEGIIERSPARSLAIPSFTRERDEAVLSLDEVQRIEYVLSGVDQAIWQLLSRCGLRAGEVFGLQWGDLGADNTIRIERTYARGCISEPKTKKSKSRVAVPAATVRDLGSLRPRGVADTQWIFPSSRKRRSDLMPIDYHNWLNRVLRPAARKLSIRVNHQILRRTFATLAYNSGGDMKDIQAQMRHTKVDTTANVYTKSVASSVRKAVETLDRRLRKR